MNTVKQIEVRNLTFIVKVAERCNLDCDYCYYYHMGDDSWRKEPPYMSDQTLDLLAARVGQVVRDISVGRVTVILHGGEPMLAKPKSLERFMIALHESVGSSATVRFGIQTNGTILSDAWLDFFARTKLGIGVSIDGPADIHDAHRVTRKGKPTHRLVSEFLNAVSARANGPERQSRPGTISVLGPNTDLARLLDHLKADFDLAAMSFVLPDDVVNNPAFGKREAAKLGRLLIDLYNASVLDRRIRSREITRFQGHLVAHDLKNFEDRPDGGFVADYVGLSVQSSGLTKVNEEMIATGQWRKDFPTLDLKASSIASYISSPRFTEYLRTLDKVPSACDGCRWRNVCRGGAVQERRNPENGFDSRSAFCETYKVLYEYMYEDLVEHGFPSERLDHVLATSVQ